MPAYSHTSALSHHRFLNGGNVFLRSIFFFFFSFRQGFHFFEAKDSSCRVRGYDSFSWFPHCFPCFVFVLRLFFFFCCFRLSCLTKMKIVQSQQLIMVSRSGLVHSLWLELIFRYSFFVFKNIFFFFHLQSRSRFVDGFGTQCRVDGSG